MGEGERVHQSPAATRWEACLSVVSLVGLFSLTLFYAVAAPLLVYVWGALPVALLAASPLLAYLPWKKFGENAVFAAWRRYFELRVVREGAPFPPRNVLLAFAPHGLFPLALPMMSGVCGEVFPEFEGRTPATAVADALLWAPLLGPLFVWLGCVSARRDSIVRNLRENNVVILPDGIAGAFHSQRKEECLYLEQRKGFVRTALEQGSLLVPVYCFGHSQLYDVYPRADSLVARLSRRIQFSLIWFWGTTWCPPLPHRVPLCVVVGEGIPLEREENPTQERVDEVHSQFKGALLSLYNRWRKQVPGYTHKRLQIL